jgi:diguanylate cyclase (GGDEF)-like protein
MTAQQESPAPGLKPWTASLVTLALVLAVAVAGLSGWLARHALELSSEAAALALAAVALGPPAFYALTLERGKAAPALRSAQAPWLLFALLHVCVQISGGLASPVWGAYPLLMLLVARNSGILNAAALTALATVLEAFPLWAQAHDVQNAGSGADIWPRGLALALPALGLALGSLSRTARPLRADNAPLTPPRPRDQGPGPHSRPSMAQSGDSGSPPLAGPLSLDQVSDSVDVGLMLDRDLLTSLEFAFHAHPQWNALSLWWGDSEGVSLRLVRMRSGSPASQARVLPGEGHLGLALRERKVLNVEALTPAAAAGLPYALPPYQARALRIQPLSDEGRLTGLLVCDKAGEADFSPEEAAALLALGNLLVQHAQRAAHLQRLQSEGARTQKLYAAAQILSKGQERESLLAGFGGLLQSLVPCDSWTLAMREEDDGALRSLAGSGYRQDAPQVLSLDRSGAIAGTLAEAEGAVLFNGQPGAQVPVVLLEGLAGEPLHFLLAPLRLEGRLVGVLKLDRSAPPFSPEERDACFIFASQAVGILEHARLFALHRLQASTDGLTGLFNHRHFQERLATELEQALRSGRPLSVALTDIDFFKKFNDSFGHQEGDRVLRKVADLVREGVRQGKDIVCRYGGEEFAVILPDCDVVEARLIMDALRARCASKLSGGDGTQSQSITLSVGLSTYPAAAREQRDLIHAADEALYKAKNTGRNRVCSFRD